MTQENYSQENQTENLLVNQVQVQFINSSEQTSLAASDSTKGSSSPESHEELIQMRKMNRKMQPNMCYLTLLVLIISLTGVLVGYAMAYQNQLNKTFYYKYKWTENNKGLWEGIIGSSVVVGMILGASGSGTVMGKGRRIAMLWASYIGIAGCIITQVTNIYALIFGRFLFGLSTGAMVCVGSKYLEETIPAKLYEVFSPLIIAGNSFGTLCAFLLGLILPNQFNTDALAKSSMWRLFYAYIPVFMYGLFILGMFTIGKHDSIKFLINTEQDEEAIKAIKDMYKDATDESAQEVLNHIKSQSGSKQSALTTWDVFCNPKYRRATWVNIGYMFFHEVAGINVIYQYSTQIYIDMHSANPRMGTIMIGVTSLISAFTSIILIRFLNRRTVFIGGHFGVGVSWIMVAYFNNEDEGFLTALSMNLFMMFYTNSSGTLAWTYAAETCVDQSLGFVIMSIYVNVIYLAIICPIIMSPESIGPSNVFFGLSAFSFIGSFYCWYFIKETKGLSDFDKKQVYMPEKYREQKPSQKKIKQKVLDNES